MNIGAELKYIREQHGLSQSELAKLTGISQQKLSYYESGKHYPPITDCITLANYYNISLDELVGRDYGSANNN